MGMAMGGLVDAVGRQMQSAVEQSAAIRERAAGLIESDPRVRDALGGGRVVVSTEAVSQSSSTMIVNGERTAYETALLVAECQRNAEQHVFPQNLLLEPTPTLQHAKALRPADCCM